MKKLLRFSLPTFCLSMILFGCLTGNDNGGASSSNVFQITSTYTANDTVLINNIPQTISTSSYCQGDSLNIHYDTTEASIDTMHYSVDGNTLTLWKTEPKPTSAIIKTTYVYARQKSGSELQGTWTQQSKSYTVVSGKLSANEKENLNFEFSSQNDNYITTVIIGASQMKIAVSILNNNAADEFIKNWNGNGNKFSDSAMYDITLTKISGTSVKLVGNVSNEVVTISVDGNLDISYMSTNTSHSSHIYYSKPKSCPDDYEPAWYSTFLEDNAKVSILKKREATPFRLKKHIGYL